MQNRFCIGIGLVCFAASVALAFNARGEYSFINVADSASVVPSGTIHGFTLPALSHGRAAFVASGVQFRGVFSGDGGPLTTIAKTGDPAPSGVFTDFGSDFLSSTDISNGIVSFFARYGSSSGVFSGSGGPLATIAKTGDSTTLGTLTFVDSRPASDGSAVSLEAGYARGEGVFTGAGGSLAALAKTGDASPVGAFTAFGQTAISGTTVAFAGFHNSASGIFTNSGGVTTTIVKTGDAAPAGTFQILNSPAIDGSAVAFWGSYPGGTDIFTSSGGVITTIAKTGDAAPSGTFTSFSNGSGGVLTSPGISDGTLAFDAHYSGGHGIFVGSGGPLTTVIKSGDALFGSNVSVLDFNGTGFDVDGSGRLAFAYQLTDGRQGIAIAAPVPEPSSCVLVGCASIAIAFVFFARPVRQGL
jgi:hypothetical protein